MPIIWDEDTQIARMLATRARIDSGGGPGVFEICSANYATVLASVLLGYPGNSTGIVDLTTLTIGGVPRVVTTLTLAGFPRVDAAIDATGTAALARIRNSAGVVIGRGMTVGLAGSNSDVFVNRTDLVAGRTFTILSAVFGHPFG